MFIIKFSNSQRSFTKFDFSPVLTVSFNSRIAFNAISGSESSWDKCSMSREAMTLLSWGLLACVLACSHLVRCFAAWWDRIWWKKSRISSFSLFIYILELIALERNCCFFFLFFFSYYVELFVVMNNSSKFYQTRHSRWKKKSYIWNPILHNL